ncbi:MAG: hypothetical protein Q9M91_05245 [Candidatus Dojkabacteria bacterium]|nr:hypothetical protein [Candidatus Dojkabacteria bacterium]MDQ7021210.1 hypothetical protein [Candidatus Dojkabacteria bacterium]
MVALTLYQDYSSNETYSFIVENSQSTMATLGIFLIGLAVSNLNVKMNKSYLFSISLIKVVINPLIILLLILLDRVTFNILEESYYEILMLIGSVPVATNSVILATEFTKKEQTAALGVLVTAILSLLSIPVWQYIVGLI